MYEAIGMVASELSRTIQVISVMDREVDSLALFDAQQCRKRVDVVVRACQDRRLSNGRTLFEMMVGGPVAKKITSEIHRRVRRVVVAIASPMPKCDLVR